MPKFSDRSKSKLATCHPLLQQLFNEIIKEIDCTIIEGMRTLEQQKEYVRTGKSRTMNSKHLLQEDGYSHAVDVMAYPIKWDDWHRNYLFAGYVRGVADKLGIKLRLGADWDGDLDPADQTFHDLPHFELRSTESTRDASSYKDVLPDGPSEEDINITLEDIENDVLND